MLKLLHLSTLWSLILVMVMQETKLLVSGLYVDAGCRGKCSEVEEGHEENEEESSGMQLDRACPIHE
ncbi:hypothetical protein SLA2020_393560 [Shorea laevis]